MTPPKRRKLVDRLTRDALDIVVGSRFGSDFRVRWFRRTAMRVLAWEVSRRLDVRITDSTSGFRAFGKRAVDRFARAYPTAYMSDTVEVLLVAGDLDLRVAEEPVMMRQRAGGRPSAGTIKSSYHLARLAMVIVLHRVRQPIRERGGIDDVEA